MFSTKNSVAGAVQVFASLRAFIIIQTEEIMVIVSHREQLDYLIVKLFSLVFIVSP